MLLYRVKCFLTCKDVLNALANLKLMLEVKADPQALFDYQLLEGLRECSEEGLAQYSTIRTRIKQAKRTNSAHFGLLFEEYDYHFYKGVMAFYDGLYEKAGNNFRRALDLI